jgi:hypothetical protein
MWWKRRQAGINRSIEREGGRDVKNIQERKEEL